MAVPIVDPPRVRPAGSLDLFEEDLNALRAFRCVVDTGAWYEREAKKVLRRAIGVYRERALGERDRVLLFQRDDELQAVSVLAEESSTTVHLAFVGLSIEFHGARIDSEDGDRLSDAVLESSLEVAQELGFRRVSAQVAREHRASRAMLDRAGFLQVSRYDHDYDLCAVELA